jgi:biotin synthase
MNSSPDYLRISLAAAMTLGLKEGVFLRNSKIYCLNLLLTYPGGCRARCAYCGLSRKAEGDKLPIKDESFIRVEWPEYPTELIIEKANESKVLERACISTITHPNSNQDTLQVLKMFKKHTTLPISILSNPTTLKESEIQKLYDEGADRFTVAIDLARPDLFEAYRGRGIKGPHNWDRYWNTLDQAREIFGDGKIGVHLISGMGETEKEMVDVVQKVSDMGGSTHLFSFNPEKNSFLETREPCDAAQYRRTQLARFLIDMKLSEASKMEFSADGQILNFGLDDKSLDEIVNTGVPFETCGCPSKDCKPTACNRPFGDGPPSDIRSYPFPLNQGDVAHVRRQMDGKIIPKEIEEVEQFEDIELDARLWKRAEKVREAGKRTDIKFYLPSFKNYATSEISNHCHKKSFPSVSITGTKCQLQCEHCKGKLLSSMIEAETPERLLQVAEHIAMSGGEGMLISGGSDKQNELPLKAFLPTIREIHKRYNLNLAVHTGLVDEETVYGLEEAGVQTAMIDIIGSNKTIQDIYHLDKTIEDFELSLQRLTATRMKIAPHIVMGLHYGQMRGEYKALEMISRYPVQSLILVVVMPHYAAQNLQ